VTGPGPITAERARVLALRKGLRPEEVARLSQETVGRFVRDCGIEPSEWQGLRVAMYRALPGELDLRDLEESLSEWGARLCFPRVLDAKRGLMELADGEPGVGGKDPSLAQAPWPSSVFGIEEPPSHHRAVDPGAVDLVFVPGVAFGERGERAGMGAGFYDRYLPKAHKALRVALAFDFQLLPGLDQQAWDQRMDWIWTERREIRLKAWTPPVRNASEK
jgi:5-formyltetrahydrofolate cyclo-ligase